MFDFSGRYEKENFINFLKTKFKLNEIDEVFKVTNKKLLVSIKKIAKIKLDEEVSLFEIEHVSKNDPRVELTNAFFTILNNYSIEKALVIFYCSDSEKYRFSLIESTLVWSNEINVKRKFSHHKRLSYLLGKDAKIHTPYNQFLKKITSYKDLKKRFDKEVVTEEFFNNYERLYLNLIDKLEKDKNFKSFAKTIDLKINVFCSKLMGQIIFCYFLQKKGWLGANKAEKLENGNLDFFRSMFNECEKKIKISITTT